MGFCIWAYERAFEDDMIHHMDVYLAVFASSKSNCKPLSNMVWKLLINQSLDLLHVVAVGQNPGWLWLEPHADML